MFLKKFLVNLMLVAALVDIAFACNGYKIKLLKLENCAGPDAIMTMDSDFNVKLNKKCEIVPSGCIINKAFGTAISKFKVTKDGMTMKEGKMNMCDMVDHVPSEAKEMMKMFGAPSKCPVAEEKLCANNHKIDMSKYKAMLSMAKGIITIDSEIEHDTGKSCVHAEIEISKG